MRQREEKGDSDSFTNSGKAQTGVETALFSFSVPGSSLPLAQLHGRPHVSKTKHAAGAATVTSVSISQSSLAIAYPFLSLSLSHTDCINQGLDQEEVVTGVQNEKGCPTAAGPDRQWRDTFSLVIKSQLCLLRLPVYVDTSRGFKGKVVVFTPWMLCIFLSRERRNAVCCSVHVTWVHLSFLGSLCKMEQGIYM